MTDQKKEYYTAREAAQYLAKKWGIESYSADAFRLLRWRAEQAGQGIEPDLDLGNGSLWKAETLDTIPKPDRSKPRPTRRKNRTEEAQPLKEH